jgi:hypothetical protein
MNGFDFGVEIEAVRNVYLPTLDLFEARRATAIAGVA